MGAPINVTPPTFAPNGDWSVGDWSENGGGGVVVDVSLMTPEFSFVSFVATAVASGVTGNCADELASAGLGDYVIEARAYNNDDEAFAYSGPVTFTGAPVVTTDNTNRLAKPIWRPIWRPVWHPSSGAIPNL
jgi:hypothetical protein